MKNLTTRFQLLALAALLSALGLGTLALGSGLTDSELTASFVKNDQELAIKSALQELELRQRTSASDARLKAELGIPSPLSSRLKFLDALKAKQKGGGSCTEKCEKVCDDDNGDHDDHHDHDSGGTESCWDSCSKQGWSTSYCAQTCGTSNDAGQDGCWESCTKSGWSTSYCAQTCGTSSDESKESCWDSCTKAGWSVSYCKQQCGT